MAEVTMCSQNWESMVWPPSLELPQTSLPAILKDIVMFCFVLGPHPAMNRGYSGLCIQESLLAGCGDFMSCRRGKLGLMHANPLYYNCLDHLKSHFDQSCLF